MTSLSTLKIQRIPDHPSNLTPLQGHLGGSLYKGDTMNRRQLIKAMCGAVIAAPVMSLAKEAPVKEYSIKLLGVDGSLDAEQRYIRSRLYEGNDSYIILPS